MPSLRIRRTSATQATRRESATASEMPKPKSTKERLGSAYARCFGSVRYRRFNGLLLYLGLRGLGVENYRNHVISGEEWFVRSLLRDSQECPVVLDVGAYHGEYAKLVRRYSPTALIYCFEPHPRSFGILQKAAHDYAFSALPLACGAQSGHVYLFDFANQDGSKRASLYEDTLHIGSEETLTKHLTEIVTLDEFAKNAASMR